MGTKMPIDKNEITKEMLEKAMQCNTVEELIAYAKTEGVDLTKEEAEGKTVTSNILRAENIHVEAGVMSFV